jgi:hypothetical protein
VFCATPGLPSDILRNIARFAECHIYSDQDDVVYANTQFVCLHALSGGNKRVILPVPASIRDALTGRALATDTNCFNCEMLPTSTCLLRLDPR